MSTIDKKSAELFWTNRWNRAVSLWQRIQRGAGEPNWWLVIGTWALAFFAAWTLFQIHASAILEQRAWLGIGRFAVTQFEEGKSLKIEIQTTNSGKTPALHRLDSVKYSVGPDVYRGPDPFAFAPLLEFQPAQAVPPEATAQSIFLELPWEGKSGQSLKDFFGRIKDQSLFISFFGEIMYQDIFGNAHSTQFCVWLKDPQTKQMAFCLAGNDMN